MALIPSRSLLALAAIATLGAGGCQREPATTPTTAEAAHATPLAGVDLAGRDLDTLPGNDFEQYANGGWRARVQIPDDRASTGAFLEVFERTEQRTAELIQSLAARPPAAGSDERRIADAYAAFMDTDGIEARGLAPIRPQLAAIEAIADKTALARMLGAELRADVDPINATDYQTGHLFGLFVAQGLSDPRRNIGYLLQGGLGLPDRDYYLSDDPAMAPLRARYRDYIARLLELAGLPGARARAEQVYALEERIARAHAPIADTQDVHKANTLWPLAEFPQRAPGLDWPTFFQAAGLAGQDRLDLWQPRAITGLAALVDSEPLQDWKDWLSFHALDEAAPYLPRAFDEARFAFRGTTLNGTPKQRTRDKRAIAEVNATLGDAVGRLYVAKYFPASARRQVQQIVAHLLAAFPARIDRLDWMNAQTKARAKAKAEGIRVGVGYPDRWRDYSKLEIRADDPLGNARRAALAEYRHQLAKLGRRPDRGEWWMTPQTVNAVNLPLQNALNFPAAILQPPFFDPDADPAAQYGGIGAVIGHEISHSFDNMGAEFDEQGRLSNWWTADDAAHFRQAGQRLAAQFDGYQALPDLAVRGEQTLGENIADLAGLTVALDAYHASLDGRPAPVVDGLSGDQRFFLAYAQVWRAKTREAALRNQVMTDVHAPGRFRAQTVRNLDAWYPAYQVEPGQALYLAPDARVRIW